MSKNNRSALSYPNSGSEGRSRGCSKEMAQKIVNLLFRESSGHALLEFNKAILNDDKALSKKSKEPAPQRRKKDGPVRRKVTVEMALFVHDNRSMSIEETTAAILEKFKIKISTGTIYKIWKIPYDQIREMKEAHEKSEMLKKSIERLGPGVIKNSEQYSTSSGRKYSR